MRERESIDKNRTKIKKEKIIFPVKKKTEWFTLRKVLNTLDEC